MKKILIIDTSYPINNRTIKFCSTLSQKFEADVLTWDRTGRVKAAPLNYHIFKKKSEVGRRVKKLIFFPGFIWFGIKVFIKLKPNLLFVSHWDSLVLGCLMKMIRPQVKLVYDCLDMPSSSNSILRSVLRWVESRCLHLVDLTIFASRYFKECYPNHLPSIVFENYPCRSHVHRNKLKPKWWPIAEEIKGNKRNYVVSWVGVVRYTSVLKVMLEAFRDLDLKLFVFGDGPSLEAAKVLAQRLEIQDKVHFWGRFSQDELPYIYSVSDFVWAAYPTDNFNAVYAVSNKYFECSLFDKIPIISLGTRMAEDLKLCNENNVILIDEVDRTDIVKKLRLASSGVYVSAKYQKEMFWEDEANNLIKLISEI